MSTEAAQRLARGVSTGRPERDQDERELAPGVYAEDVTEERAPAAAGSPLLSLYERIEEAEAEEPLHLDLMVPRMRGVGVRYRPVGSVEMASIERRITAKGSRVPKERQQLIVNATVLAVACLGVFVIDESTGEPAGDPSTWVLPGPQLARELRKSEAEMPTSADTILGLYRTEGDAMAAGLELLTWSSTDSAQREDLDLKD